MAEGVPALGVAVADRKFRKEREEGERDLDLGEPLVILLSIFSRHWLPSPARASPCPCASAAGSRRRHGQRSGSQEYHITTREPSTRKMENKELLETVYTPCSSGGS